MSRLQVLVASAVASSAALASVGSAAVVSSGPLSLAIPDNGTGLYVNVVTGTTFTGPGIFPALGGPGENYDFNIFGGTTAWNTFSPGSSGQSLPNPVPATSKGYVSTTATGPLAPLAPGTTIDGSSTFNTGSPSATALGTGVNTFIGFRFRNENDPAVATDDTVHFGYALINLPPATLTQNGTLLAYAYESTPGAAITIPVPEPVSVAAVTGLGGLLLRRRRA